MATLYLFRYGNKRIKPGLTPSQPILDTQKRSASTAQQTMSGASGAAGDQD
jgi:hypothetical protein